MHDVEHVFQLFYASEYAREINHLLLSGNATDLPCMAHVLSTRLNLPAAIINPLAYLDFADDRLRELMDINAPQLLAALGLALR